MSLLATAADLFARQLGNSGVPVDAAAIVPALQQLLPTAGQDIDLAQLGQWLGQSGGGLAALAGQFLGQSQLAPEQLLQNLGAEPLAEFASQLGLPLDTALGGLANILPQLLSQGLSTDNLGDVASSILGKWL
jgi:uncharacterized protein YidB (DUF937 family)